ncbi:MAG: hypothetical protein GXY01_01150 [Clostridiales bacterium]|jgi:stage III sporulation protein AG|nr:hypothetical protein [Clostridiales bacterium]
MKNNDEKKQFKLLDILKNKYALIVLAAGLLLILLPTGNKPEDKAERNEIKAPEFSITDEESRLEKQLCKIRGAGRVSVLLSVEGSPSRELANSGDETLVVSENGKERVVELYYVNPEYMGAIIVCDGADSAEVRLAITKAVSAYTGLSTNKITVMSMS